VRRFARAINTPRTGTARHEHLWLDRPDKAKSVIALEKTGQFVDSIPRATTLRANRSRNPGRRLGNAFNDNQQIPGPGGNNGAPASLQCAPGIGRY
jgi:hypothetical protein